MIYGYVRISTPKQSLDRQIKNILSLYPTATIISEVYTGTKIATRPNWNKLIKRLKPKDTIVFDSVSRMSRNANEGFEMYMELYENQIELVFLKEPHINTSTYKDSKPDKIYIPSTGDSATDDFLDALSKALNTYMIRLVEKQIHIAFDQSEKEVIDLHNRTSEGMKASGATSEYSYDETGNQVILKPGKISLAKKGQTYVTKKSVLIKDTILKHSKDFGGSLNDIEVMKLCGCSRNTYYAYKKQLRLQN
ncbi:MAG: recombinase family protein [Clostridia bacterium]|nr:recombinase family protein [Clostridia bacterium]